MLPGDAAQRAQVPGAVEAHAPGPLHHGLHDDGRELVGVLGDRPLQVGDVIGVGVGVEALGRGVGEHLPGKDVAPERVHAALRVAHRHGVEGVPVVPAAPGHDPAALRPALRALVLQAHLEGDLDRHRPGVGEEHVPQVARGRGGQQRRQARGGLMGQTAEHDVAEAVDLGAGGGVEDGVAVAVDRRPPGGHAVDDLPFAAVVADEAQARALGTGDDVGGAGGAGPHGRIGVPEQVAVDFADPLGCGVCGRGGVGATGGRSGRRRHDRSSSLGRTAPGDAPPHRFARAMFVSSRA